MKHPKRLAISLGVAALLLWFLTPIYGFFSHNGAVPLGPFGWVTVPENVPETQRLLDSRYETSGNEAIEVMRSHRARINAPALSAAVAVGGDMVWAGSVGWADIENNAQATPDTRFRIGSTSKALTSAALARLVDADQIDLDAPISTYVEELPNPAWADITPRQLASHMAGMPHYAENTDWLGLYKTMALQTHYDSMTDALEVFDGSDLLSEPGSEFYYSSLGTVLLGAAMSHASGVPYLELMQREVFGPAGMTATVVSPARSDSMENMATPYKSRDDELRPWRPVDLSHRLPGGGFASTSTDLVRLGITFLDDDFLSAETRATFWTPQVLNDGTPNPQDYALGWRVKEWEIDDFGLVRNANHGGVSRGGQSWLLVFPDHDMVIAYNTNIKTPEFGDFALIYPDLFSVFAENLN